MIRVAVIRDAVIQTAMMLLLSAKSCQARYGLTVLLLSLVLAACAGNGGGGSGTSSPSGVDRSGIDVVENFAFVRPDTNSVLLNWTNPVLEDDEGIYKFTISYKAVDRPDSAKDLKSLANRSRILDWDNDGVVASMDNCLHVANSGQPDRDKDGVGDACDSIDSSLSFIPSEDAVVIRWLNPLRPADAVVSSTRGPLEGYADSSRRLVGANLTLELLDNGTSIRFEWINPSASVSGLTGEVTITQFSIPGFLDYTANRMNNEHEANTNVSVEQEIAADQRAGLLPGVELPLELQATYDNGTQRATVPIKTDCVLISTDNMIAPCGAEPHYGLPVVDATASGPVIKYFRLMVEDPTGMMDEVRLAADADINVSYSQANAIPVMVEYTYNRTGLVTDPRGYSFSLGIGYDNESGEQFLDAAALLARSPVEAGYNGSVVLGLNTDGDALIDTLDNDSDADGIPNGMDSMELRSALGSVPLGVALGSVTDAPVEFIYEGDEALLGLFGSNRSSFYELEGLAEDSYYTFMVRAHIREYRNEGLAAVLGYGYNPATGRMEAIPDAYAINQTEGSVKAVARTKDEDPTFIGLNTDGDGLANVLDADDDNDGLLDTEEVDAAGVPLMVGGVLCSLLADCDNDTIEDGDARERLVNGDNVSCSLLLDCDGDMVEDSVDAFIVDPFESKDRDGDRVGDNSDNCIFIANAGQVDGDRDGRGDACEGTDAGGVEGAAGGRYHYRGSVAKPDLTVIPGEDHVLISWVHLYPAAVNASFTAAGVAIERAVIGWEVYNLEQNGSDSSWTVGLLDDGAEIEVYTDEAYAVGEVYSIVLDATNITAWHNTVDPGYGYRFNVTFTYDDHDATEATVYAYPILADASNLVRLLLNTDGDEYADVVDPNDDNDGLLDSDEVDRDGAPLLNASGFPCSRLVDCDGDGVDDVSDAFPVDPAEWMDRDRDGIGDNADTFVGFVSDKDRDGRLDAADSCLLVANAVVAGAEVNIDNDNINDACDVNTTAVQDVWFIPQDGALVASWFNPAGVFGFNVSIFSGGSRVVQSGALDSSALLAGFLSAGNYSHYRVEGLTNGEDYNVVVVLLGSDGSMVGLPLGSERDFLYRVRVGENADSDALADSLDLDADNDGLPNTDANEQLMNSDGISCSRLVDCDGDGVSDVSDAFPSDSAETLDSDSDGIGDNADVFPGNPAEVTDSDFDGFGDNIDNCDFRVNFDQANHDGDSEGDVCDADDTNPPDSRVVDFPGSNTYEVTEDEGTANETVVLFSEVVVTWTNPVDLYLPKAVFQPHSSLDVLSFALDILQGGEAVAQAGLNITFVAGADRGDVAVLNRTAGIETGYRIRGLDNGTRYTFVVSAEYSYEALEVDSSDQDATENRTETIVLATVEVETPAVAGVPAVDFTAASGEDVISISWTRPRVPSGYELTGIDVLGCRLDNADDQCDASTADKLYSVSDTVIMTDNADQPPIIPLPPSASVERAYLYNITLNATYMKDGRAEEWALSEPVLVAIYPDNIPGPIVVGDSDDGKDAFSFRFSGVDTTTEHYRLFEQIGEEIAYYNVTLFVDEADGPYRHTTRFTVDQWRDLGNVLDSDQLIPDTNQRIGGRFYHVELSAVYTTGQRSPVGRTAATGYVQAALWPTPQPVPSVTGGRDGSGLRVTWTLPNIQAFTNIGQNIQQFIIQACKQHNQTDCSDTKEVISPTATQQTIIKQDGLEFDELYILNVTVEYTTGQQSSSVFSPSDMPVNIPFSAQLDVTGFTATGDSADHLSLSWTNPSEPTGDFAGLFTIKHFEIIPCRYETHEADCVNRSPIILTADDMGVSGAFGGMNNYDISVRPAIEQARVYDFTITVIYRETGAEDRESGSSTAQGVQLPSNIPGVRDINAVNGFGEFTLSWAAPADISNFTRIGESVAKYRIDVYQGIRDLHQYTGISGDFDHRGNMTFNADDLRFFDETSSKYVITNSLLDVRLPSGINGLAVPENFLPTEGQVYTVNITTIYTTGQQSPTNNSQRALISIGPVLEAPDVTAATKADSLEISWTFPDIPDDLKVLKYGLGSFQVGAHCNPTHDQTSSINCNRRLSDLVDNPSTIVFNATKPTGESEQGEDLPRGEWFHNVVRASYILPDGSTTKWVVGSDGGGIYPEVSGVTGLIYADSYINDIEIGWDWDTFTMTPEFQRETNYSRKIVVSGMDAEDDIDISLSPRELIYNSQTEDNPFIYISNAPYGQLFDLTLATVYSGNSNHPYNISIPGPSLQAGIYPPEELSLNITPHQVQSGEVIRVSWDRPDLMSRWGNQFLAWLGYDVKAYKLRACPDAGGSCETFDVADPGGPARITHDLTSLDRGVLYNIAVQVIYEGKHSPSGELASSGALADSYFLTIPGDHYLNPAEEALMPVSGVEIEQLSNENVLSIEFTKPSGLSLFTGLGFTHLSYNLTLYDNHSNPVSDSMIITRPLSTPQSMVTVERFPFQGINYDLNHSIKVQVIYPTNQLSDAVDSNSILLKEIVYRTVQNIQARSGYDNITLSWDVPSSIPGGANISKFRIDIVCDESDSRNPFHDPTYNCYKFKSNLKRFAYTQDEIPFVNGKSSYVFTYTHSDGSLEPGALYLANITVEYIQPDNSVRNVSLEPAGQPKVALFPAINPPRATVIARQGSIGVDFQPAGIATTIISSSNLPSTTPKPYFIDHFNYRPAESPYGIDVDNHLTGDTLYTERVAAAGSHNISYFDPPSPLQLYRVSVFARFTVNSENTFFPDGEVLVRSEYAIAGGYPLHPPGVDSATATSDDHSIKVNVVVSNLISSAPFVVSPSLSNFRNEYRYDFRNYRIELCEVDNPTKCVTQLIDDTYRASMDQFEVVITDSTVTKGKQYRIHVYADYDSVLLPTVLSSAAVTIAGDYSIPPDDGDLDDDGDGLIEIATVAQLKMIGQDLSGSSLGGNTSGCPVDGCIGYELSNDISLTDNWVPVGTRDNPFKGIFNGNGHTIRGLSIDADLIWVGFFSVLEGATVKNIHFEFDEIISRSTNARPFLGTVAGSMYRGSRLIYVSAIGDGLATIGRDPLTRDATGIRDAVGGLVGAMGSRISRPNPNDLPNQIIGSFVRINTINTTKYVGGLMGEGHVNSTADTVMGSYAQVGSLVSFADHTGSGDDPFFGGLIGRTPSNNLRSDGLLNINNSYAVIGDINSHQRKIFSGPVIGTENNGPPHSQIELDQVYGVVPRPEGGFKNEDGLKPAADLKGYASTSSEVSKWTSTTGVTHPLGIWCDTDDSGSIEADERRDTNLLWDFGTSTQYPAIRCSVIDIATQRELHIE